MESVPREILAALAPGATELRALGFELSHFMTVTDLNAGIRSPAHASVYYNPVYTCYADLNASLTPDRVFPYRVNLYLFFDEGLLFLTMNQDAYSVIEGSPSLIAKNAFALTLSEQLAAHRDGVERFETSCGRFARKSQLEPGELISKLNSNYAYYTSFLREQGWA